MLNKYFQIDYRPQFSGHETFPLRYGWLKKAYDEVVEVNPKSNNKSIFLSEDAIGRFGVGKNMVSSIRHWASATGILCEDRVAGVIKPTKLGDLIFGKDGCDRYMENPTSLWLIHWQLAGKPQKTTWFWAFNLYPDRSFGREQFVASLARMANEKNWHRVGITTLKNDVACFIRTYVPQRVSARIGIDDTLESPLTELELLKGVGRRDGFKFVHNRKLSLGGGMFTYALLEFWSNHSKDSATLSMESVAHAPGSPGRVFLLSESEVIDRMIDLEAITNGRLQWSETAGLKQVMRKQDINQDDRIAFLKMDYE